jgi:hypothetical protein
MAWKTRMAVGVTAAAALLGAGLAAAPAALADRPGDEVPEQLEAEILALPWVTLCEGDEGALVDGVKHLLIAYGVPYEPEFPGYDDHMVDRVEYYQQMKNEEGADIPVDGSCVYDETWHHFREDYGVVSSGEGGRVRFAQLMLIEHGYLEPGGADGVWGPATEEAVKAFQRDTCDSQGDCLDDDGIVGPLTFRALATGGI